MGNRKHYFHCWEMQCYVNQLLLAVPHGMINGIGLGVEASWPAPDKSLWQEMKA